MRYVINNIGHTAQLGPCVQLTANNRLRHRPALAGTHFYQTMLNAYRHALTC